MKTFLIFLKWTVIVWLNAIISLIFAIEPNTTVIDILGIVSGVFTFVFIYTAVDWYLIQMDKQNLRKSLLISTLLKALTQFYPMIEIMTGVLATDAIKYLIGKVDFFSMYFATVLDGILLSIIVAFLMFFIELIRNIYKMIWLKQ